MRRLFFFVIACALSLNVWAQSTVSGTVTASESGDPIEGVAVQVKGTTVGMFTDSEGQYTVKVPESSETLVFSFVGRSKMEVAINGRSSIDVVMQPSDLALDEVVVTAFGVAKDKRSLGYAVQEVGGDELVKAKEVNLTNALSAKVAGVQVVSSSGAPGSSANIRIRGNSSISGNNAPLFVIDGVPIDNSEFASQNRVAGVANSNRLIDLNAYDIEDMTVLKGLAATSTYGVRGANGVVLITTKKGSRGQSGPSISFNSSLRIDQPNKLHPLQFDWVQGNNGDIREGTSYGWSWGAKGDTLFRDGSNDWPWDKGGRLIGAAEAQGISGATPFSPYDNQEQFWVDGQVIENSLSISGGTGNSTYLLSVGRLDQTGIIPNSDFSRTTFKVSASTQFTDKFKLSGSANYINSGGNRVQQGSNISGIMLGLSRTPINFDNSNGFGDDAVDEVSAYEFVPNNPFGIAPGTQRNYRSGGGYDNPYWTVNNVPFRDRVDRVIAYTQADYTFLPSLSATYRIGIDHYGDDRSGGYEINSRDQPGGQVFQDLITSTDINSDFLLNFSPDINDDFSLDFTLGHSVWIKNIRNTYTVGNGLVLQDFINMSNAESIQSTDVTNRRALAGVFANASLSYQDMLYLTVTGRNDWSSTLDQSNNSFFYPSASLGFVFTEALGLSGSTVFPYGKLRVSYAQAANDATPYATQTNFEAGSAGDGWTVTLTSPFNGILGYQISNVLGDPNLSPERSSEIEIGAELRFFSNRIGLDVTYYDRTSDGVIFPILISPASGFGNIRTNAATISNSGIEAFLTVTPVKTQDFQWDITANFTRNRNIVDELAEGIDNVFLAGFTGTSSRAVAGQPYGAIYGGRWLRDDQGRRLIQPNGFPIVDPEEGFLGDPNPDFLLGVGTNLSYKGIFVSGLLDIREGGQIWNGTKGALVFVGTAEATNVRGNTTTFDGVDAVFNDETLAWESTGEVNDTEVTLGQGWYQGNGGGFGDQSEDFIEDGSWIRLREVSIGYSVPSGMLSKLPFAGIDISFSGRNLWLQTDFDGIDPETNLTGATNGIGLEYFNMPNTKSYSFNLGLRF